MTSKEKDEDQEDNKDKEEDEDKDEDEEEEEDDEDKEYKDKEEKEKEEQQEQEDEDEDQQEQEDKEEQQQENEVEEEDEDNDDEDDDEKLNFYFQILYGSGSETLQRNSLATYLKNLALIIQLVNWLIVFRTLIANRKYKLAVPQLLAISPLSEDTNFSTFPLNEKFCGLSGLSGLVPSYDLLAHRISVCPFLSLLIIGRQCCRAGPFLTRGSGSGSSSYKK